MHNLFSLRTKKLLQKHENIWKLQACKQRNTHTHVIFTRVNATYRVVTRVVNFYVLKSIKINNPQLNNLKFWEKLFCTCMKNFLTASFL